MGAVSGQVEVNYDGITKPFEVRVIKGEGMPVHNFPSQKGDLHVKYHVDFPQRLSPDQQAKIAQLFG